MDMRFAFSLLLLLATAARADQTPLSPPASAVELRSYGLGLLPFDGKFTRFHGWLRYDPSNPGACQVMLEIEAGSLTMSSDTVRDRITGPEMMDVAKFPDLAFHGACEGETVAGMLTMHGQTHPFSLDIVRSAGKIEATGRLRRAEWGVGGSPVLGGSTVRIRVTTPDPLKNGSQT
jgi:polyisoprenoid-binding protein YceI